MARNLVRWSPNDVDPDEIRLLIDEYIKGHGQYSGCGDEQNVLYLPLADHSCRLKLVYGKMGISRIEPGPSFDPDEWERISVDIDEALQKGERCIGRNYSFSSFRVRGSWMGEKSGVHIVAPPQDAPQAPVEMAEHPFILEFPMERSRIWQVTNHRWRTNHRKLTLILNILLRGRTNAQNDRIHHCWAMIGRGNEEVQTLWVQQGFFAKIGDHQISNNYLNRLCGMSEIAREKYYSLARQGNDGSLLDVPEDLDEKLTKYMSLSRDNAMKINRAAYWYDLAPRQWHISLSASYISLVSAIEALVGRGKSHAFLCPKCGSNCQHEVPSATERFRLFLDEFAPGRSLRAVRSAMYQLRSKIVHGDDLIKRDMGITANSDPPWYAEQTMIHELWELTRTSIRNWLEKIEYISSH